jgi:hypothetical protein
MRNDKSERNAGCTVARIAAAVALGGLAAYGVGTMPSARAQIAPDRGNGPIGATGPSLHQQLNDVLGLGRSELVRLDLNVEIGAPGVVNVPVDGEMLTFDLVPYSTRSETYQVLVSQNGELVPVMPGPVKTVRGTVAEIPGSQVAGSVTEEGLTAMVMLPEGGRIMVEPAFRHLPGLDDDDHVVYTDDDVVGFGGECGWSEEWQEANGGFEDTGDGGSVAGAGVPPFRCALLALEADFPYFQDYGSVGAVEDRMNTVINTMNLQYQNQVDINHLIGTIVIRTSSGDDPYSTNNGGVLLDQFTSVWNSAPEASIPRDLAQLFSGRNPSTSAIGVAWLATVCDTSGSVQATSIVFSDFNGSFSCATDLSAHEIAHNWAAQHCSCSTTMNSSITCSNTFGSAAINTISNFRDSRSCLDDCSGGTTTFPFFDDFPSTALDFSKWGLNQGQITSVAQNEPSPPNSLNLDGSSSSGGDVIETNVFEAAGLSDITVSYWWSRGNTGNPPEPNEDLVLEYQDASFSWVEIDRQLGSGPSSNSFTQESIALPPSAAHDNLKIRFRAISLNNGADDWFIDDVGITAQTPPINNACNVGTLVGDGSVAFDTAGADTDGPDESGACGADAESDIWYRYFAQCEGDLTVSVSGASFDPVVVVYGSNCPTGPGEALGCFAGPGQSEVTVPVLPGFHRIRIGGVGDTEGTGTVTFSCAAVAACPADCADGGDGFVDVTDLLRVLAQWATGTECDVDDGTSTGTSDGTTDVSDLLFILAEWGPC